MLCPLTLSLLLAAAPVPALPIHVETRELPPCLNRARIRFAVEKQLAEGESAASFPLRLIVSGPDPLAVVLVDQKGTRLGERNVEVISAECIHLPRTIALMVEAWLQRVPIPLLSAPESPANESAPDELSGDTPISPVDVPGEAVPEATAPLLPRSQESAGSAPEVASTEELPLPVPTAPASSSSHMLRLALLGGGQLLGDGKAGGYHGAASLSVSASAGVGLALVSSFDSTIVSADAPARIDCSAQTLDVLLVIRSPVDEVSSVSFLVGPSAHRLAATSQGFTSSGSATRFDLGAAALGQWEREVFSRLSLLVGLRAGVRIHDDTFRVSHSDGTTTTLKVPPLRLSASVGLSLRLL